LLYETNCDVKAIVLEDWGFGVSQSLFNELEECDWCKVYSFIRNKEPLLRIGCLLATIQQKYVSRFGPEAVRTEFDQQT
jgi:hypothetical protein